MILLPFHLYYTHTHIYTHPHTQSSEHTFLFFQSHEPDFLNDASQENTVTLINEAVVLLTGNISIFDLRLITLLPTFLYSSFFMAN